MNKPHFVRGDDVRLLGMLHATADRHGLAVGKLRYGGRTHVLVNIRREFAWQARKDGYSLPQIGWALGCHHTSVLHLLKTAWRWLREAKEPK